LAITYLGKNKQYFKFYLILKIYVVIFNEFVLNDKKRNSQFSFPYMDSDDLLTFLKINN